MNKTDQQAIQAIEKELNIKLEKLDKIYWNSKGYILNEKGQVIGLSCNYCKIKDLNRIIEPLKDLSNLSILVLNSNEIRELSGLKDLRNLSTLDLGSNQISKLSGLKDLRNLRILVLNDNQIKELSRLKGLRKLQYLYLINNPIKELPAWITDFDMEIQWTDNIFEGISFYDNPLISPPIEIVKQGKEAIRNYFEQLESQGDR